MSNNEVDNNRLQLQSHVREIDNAIKTGVFAYVVVTRMFVATQMTYMCHACCREMAQKIFHEPGCGGDYVSP